MFTITLKFIIQNALYNSINNYIIQSTIFFEGKKCGFAQKNISDLSLSSLIFICLCYVIINNLEGFIAPKVSNFKIPIENLTLQRNLKIIHINLCHHGFEIRM